MERFFANGQPIVNTITNTTSSGFVVKWNGQANTITTGGDGANPLSEEEATKAAQVRIKARNNLRKQRRNRSV